MSLVARIVNAVSPRRGPRPGVVLKPRAEDQFRDYPADGLTPQRLVAIFREADAGDIGSQMALFEQMEEKDAHLYSVARTRRLAVTGLPWEIVSARHLPGWSGRTDGALADAAAEHCEQVLRRLDSFETALAHLSLAVGRNLALVELVWESDEDGPRLMDLAPVDFGRLTVGPVGQVRVVTEASRFEGIDLPPDKFMVHAPHAASGHPMRGGLFRATALAYLGKRFALKDWLIFAEVFGMPVRLARYAPNATPEEKRELLGMLKQLGADATGIFSKAVELQIVQSRFPGEVNLYENLCLYLDREMSKAWLGQTLTTDTARMLASAGAAKVHDQVRRDLRDDDLRKEAVCIRRDLLAPLTRLRFGPDAPVPHFRRVLDHRFEPERLAEVLDVMVNRLGARVPASWVHAAFGIPEAGEGDETLSGASASAAGPSKEKGTDG